MPLAWHGESLNADTDLALQAFCWDWRHFRGTVNESTCVFLHQRIFAFRMLSLFISRLGCRALLWAALDLMPLIAVRVECARPGHM